MTNTALITGASGQDAAWLAQLLLSKGYRVVGGMRRNASGSLWRLTELGIDKDVEIVPFELLELPLMLRTLEKVRPDEVYNLAAQTFVQASFDEPLHTADVTGIGALRLLEAVRQACPTARYYQASSSEMFGNSIQSMFTLDENAPMHPRSPYGIAKLFAYWCTRNYREAYGLHASNGILFNHESPLRGPEFVTRKISMGVAKIVAGQDHVIRLGNLDAKRDWGFAGDFVRAMWLMLQQDKPDDYVIATGESHSVREFVNTAFITTASHSPEWMVANDGSGMCGFGFDRHRVVVQVDPALYRPAEVDVLLGDASKARRVLGWEPTVSFDELVREMVEADLRREKR